MSWAKIVYMPIIESLRRLFFVLLFIIRLWQFQNFNSIQSALYPTVAKSDCNVVVSAPTGCGKVRNKWGSPRCLGICALAQWYRLVYRYRQKI